MVDSRTGAENYRISLEHLVLQKISKYSVNNGERSKRNKVSSKGYDWEMANLGKIEHQNNKLFFLPHLFVWLAFCICQWTSNDRIRIASLGHQHKNNWLKQESVMDVTLNLPGEILRSNQIFTESQSTSTWDTYKIQKVKCNFTVDKPYRHFLTTWSKSTLPVIKLSMHLQIYCTGKKLASLG